MSGASLSLKPARPFPQAADRLAARSAQRWLLAFLLLLLACQVALLVPALAPLRVLIRSAAFGVSLLYLAVIPGRSLPHPAARWAVAVVVIVLLGVLHPTTNTLTSAAAQVGLYVAILAPLWWVTRLRISPDVFRLLLYVFWAAHAASAAVGVLQVSFPGRFQPPVSSVVRQEFYDSLKIELASGEKVFRPMGLTDVPGGAATGGMYAVLFGLAFVTQKGGRLLRALAAASMLLGLFCIYLSQVRSILVMTGICGAAFLLVLFRRGEVGRAGVILALAAAVAVGSFAWATAVGGKAVTGRMQTLVEDRASAVYYRNRGRFLEDTVYVLLPEHPLGAGLGRWGMTNLYFGDNSDPDRQMIWVEIQWTGWLLDGGVPLILAYVGAIAVTGWSAWRISTSPLSGELPTQAALVLAYDVGAIAVLFNYPLFIGQGGMEFWFLNALLFAAAWWRRQAARARPA
jgi:hypothetical protein